MHRPPYRRLWPWLLVALGVTLLGCSHTYQARSEHQTTGADLDRIFRTAEHDDWIVLTLTNGTLIEGHFFSYADGLITLRIGTSFRDAEVTEVRAVSIRPDTVHHAKIWMTAMVVGMMGLIVYFFASSHP